MALSSAWISLRSLPILALTGGGHATGTRGVVLAVGGLLAALVLWSFLWAGAYGLLVRRSGSIADPRILLLLGICASALGAVIVFSYPASASCITCAVPPGRSGC